MNPGTESADLQERPVSWAFQLALCLLGPLLFLSYVLSLLSPFPLLYLHSGTPHPARGRLWAMLAVALGTALVCTIKGLGGGIGFFVLACVPAFVLGEMLLRKKGPEKAIGGAFLAVVVAAAASIFLAAQVRGIALMPTLRAAVESQVKAITASLLAQNQGDIPTQTVEQLQQLSANPALVLEELPGLLATAALLLCTLPCLALVRWNPKGFLRRTGIHRDFLRKWRSPDWLVWPALFSGLFLLLPEETLQKVGNNLLKPILLIYFFQGMSILAYFLDSLRLRGPFRVLFYGAGIVFLTPMVVSFGFFDLWFNFRGRHKPPAEDKEP